MNEDRFVPPVIEKISDPLPLTESEFEKDTAETRLWIGNLDLTITEYNILQVLKKCGKIKQFDFLVHRTGALQGQPRGFCFVSYENKVDAIDAISKLNDKKVGNKKLHVRWAHNHSTNNKQKEVTLKLPSNLTKDENESVPFESGATNTNTNEMIQAIERKLNQMQKNSEANSSSQLHPLLAISKQKETELQRQKNQPYYKRKRHKK